MLINLTELFSIDGKSKTYTQELEMTQFPTADGMCEIVDKQPVTLVIVNQGDKILTVKGEADLSLLIPCARCLEPVTVPFHLAIDQEVDLKQTEEDRAAVLDEQFYINGYNLDVDQLVGNELTLNLPMKVLCREDCQGIFNRCGTNPNQGACSEENKPRDPRMSVIQDIFKQSKEV